MAIVPPLPTAEESDDQRIARRERQRSDEVRQALAVARRYGEERERNQGRQLGSVPIRTPQRTNLCPTIQTQLPWNGKCTRINGRWLNGLAATSTCSGGRKAYLEPWL